MKSIEEIEKLSIEELEAASSGFKVPEGFRRRIDDAILSEATLAVRGVVAALAVAAAVAAVLLIRRPSELKDSFDDPMLAYAQVEQTFQYISSKMSGGLEVVREAKPIAGRPEEIIRKINTK